MNRTLYLFLDVEIVYRDIKFIVLSSRSFNIFYAFNKGITHLLKDESVRMPWYIRENQKLIQCRIFQIYPPYQSWARIQHQVGINLLPFPVLLFKDQRYQERFFLEDKRKKT